MILFTPFQRQIISYIIAENEEIDEPNPITPYMHAFDGGLMADVLCPVFEERIRRYPLCIKHRWYRIIPAIKKKIVEIADQVFYTE